MGRDERIYEEAAALWRQLYGEPPPAGDAAAILDGILGDLPREAYSRLATDHLRPSNIAFPKG
ncbi:MAG: hypothetical protein JNL41_09110 [Phenylobacterium sp.]|uniref:hypothetical protein n=1 Tax=Phenylobacterium sp. TaxID=1871053 RepID=UPI001A3DE08C|nr:hypothetical protein [Phenylobacterium sp.]MBL8554423.1 hypothetical protein [Phenylobacterium sp.]